METSPTSSTPESLVESRDHYTYQVKLLIDMYNAGKLPNVRNIVVEPRYGYIASINYVNGESRIIYGHDPGFNTGSSEQLAKDKGYTKFMLRELGVNCPAGDEFLLPWWADMLSKSDRNISSDVMQTTDDASGYIEQTLRYPVYVKPVSGSQGSGVQKIYNDQELSGLFAHYNEERVKVALVEEALDMPDYRLLLFDGELVNAYERQPFSVIGDGENDLETLIGDKAAAYKEQGRDIRLEERRAHIVQRLGRLGLQMDEVPELDQHIQLLDISNLSAGGVPHDITDTVHPHWVELARTVAKGFNLRVCGLDLACSDIANPDSDYAVIEVNATPGAKQFMASGQAGKEKLEALFLHFFRTSKQ